MYQRSCGPCTNATWQISFSIPKLHRLDTSLLVCRKLGGSFLHPQSKLPMAAKDRTLPRMAIIVHTLPQRWLKAMGSCTPLLKAAKHYTLSPKEERCPWAIPETDEGFISPSKGGLCLCDTLPAAKARGGHTLLLEGDEDHVSSPKGG